MNKYIVSFFFYSAKLVKEETFSKWCGDGLVIKNTIFWISEKGDNKFQVFVRGIQKRDICILVVVSATLQ